jgi:peptide/nickel transport system permease protein
MLTRIVTRTAGSAAMLFGLATLVFIIMRLSPGDPVSAMISPGVPARAASELRRQFGLDEPLPVQYARWLRSASSGNLGISFAHQRPVSGVIAEVLPNTALLALAAIILEFVLGILLGMAAAGRQGSALDSALSHLGLVVYSLPAFWVGFILLSVFAYGFGFFPSSQMHALGGESLSPAASAVDLLRHLALPALTIALPGAAGIARYFREQLVRVKQQEYVTFARSLGIQGRRLFLYHELPNALSPVLSVLGLEIGTLLAGAVVTETMFAWPGMGRLAVMAIYSRDYPLVMGCTIVSGVIIILGNLAADLLIMAVDPRVRERA